jgi:hypothetical protein
VIAASERLPLTLFSATGLPLIVVITTIGTSEGRMLPENAAALVGAGLLSALVFPALGLRLLRRGGGPEGDISGRIVPPADEHGLPGAL